MADLAADPGTYFPNAPLKEVAFEVRFNPLLKIERDIARFQEGITQEYPLLGKEVTLTDGEQGSTFLFHTADKRKTIRASVRSFGLSTTGYHHFPPFREELLEKTNVFCHCYDVTSFTRVGLRYINNIEVPERQGAYDFTELVYPHLNLQRVSAKDIQKMAQEIVLTRKTGALAIRSGLLPLPPVPGREEKKAVYILDLDFYTETVTPLEQLSGLVATFHDEIEREFLSQVTKSMVRIMKGEG